MSPDLLAGGWMLVLAAWLTATAAARTAPRLAPTRATEPEEVFLRAALGFTLGVVVPTAALGLLGWLTTPALLAVAGLLFLLAWRAPATLAPARPSGAQRLSLPAVGGPAALSALVIWGDLLAYLPSSPVSWDAMTYHLYFPARWLQEGRLFHIPTVFSDNAAAFAPQNGGLIFAWCMGLSGSDAVVNVVQLGALVVSAVAVYRIGRHLGVGPEAAALAGLTVLWLAPARRWALSANVDIFLVTFWLLALCWQLGYWRRPESGTIAASGLAAGLAVGTKTVGLPLVALTALGLLPVVLWRRRFRHLALYLVGLMVGGGWWLVRNAWHFGNPLFPVELSFGPWRLAGAYDSDAIRAGEFHLEGLVAVAASAWRQLGPTAVSLAAFGLAVLGLGAVSAVRRREPNGLPQLFLVALAIVWAVFFAVVVPHNNQARFLIPTLMLGLVGWAWVLDRAGALRRFAQLGLWAAGVVAVAAPEPPWQAWASQVEALSEGGVSLTGWGTLATLALLLALGARWLATRRESASGRRVAAGLGGVLAAGVLTLAAHEAGLARSAFLERADFHGWSPGYLAFNRADAPPEPLRIAYTGSNVPYALMGQGWRHRVVYINTRGEAGDGFYDFWRRDPRQHAYHKPGIYRGADDFELWLERLEQERIDLVVIFRLHWAEARYLETTADGFPVELAWARAHPDRFEAVATGPVAAIYRFLAP